MDVQAVPQIPFGPLAGPDLTLAWPPDFDVRMSVAGFEDAFSASIRIRVDPDLEVRVASLPGLMLMKLFAWRDRHRVSGKDAFDLRLLLACHELAGNQDRIFDEGVMAAEDFDAERAAAGLMGRDVARIVNPHTRIPAYPHTRVALVAIPDAELGEQGVGTLVSELAYDPGFRYSGRSLEEARVAGMRDRLLAFRAGLDG